MKYRKVYCVYLIVQFIFGSSIPPLHDGSQLTVYVYYMYYEIFCNRYWQSPTTNCHWVLHRGGLWENFTFLFLQRKLFLIIWPSIDYLHIHLKYSNIYFLSLFSIHFRSIWFKIIWKIYVTIPLFYEFPEKTLKFCLPSR